MLALDALALRSLGLSWRAIAERLDTTPHALVEAVAAYRAQQALEASVRRERAAFEALLGRGA